MSAALRRTSPQAPRRAAAGAGERIATLARERLRTLPSPHAVGPIGRERAVALLAAGYTDTAVGHELGVDRGTVRRWRHEPDVAMALAAARREREAAAAEALDDARRILCEAAPRAAQALVDGLDDDDPRVALAAAAALLDRVGMVKGATAPPSASDTAAARLRRMTDAELEQELARLEANANRGRVAIYLPAEVDPASPEALHARLATLAARAAGPPVVMLPALDGEPSATGE